MFYAAFPPEINSGRIYSGPGSGPLLAAAAAWDGLANDLQSTAASYSSVISSLTAGPWLGPTALSMTAAVTPYLSWMQGTAAQAAETATQATAAASAFETAFAAHVPPEEIAANRSQLACWSRPTLSGRTLQQSRPPKPSTGKCGPRTRWRWTPTPPHRRLPPS